MACVYWRAVHSISPGRLAEANHTPWAVCLGSSLPCQFKPGPSYAAAGFGVQREAGLRWPVLRVATDAS